MNPISKLARLLETMDPVLNTGRFVYVTLSDPSLIPREEIIASIREPEGLSVIVSSETAQRRGIEGTFPCAWITLTTHSDLAAVGFTSVFATALGNAGISCNVVAGTNHDHVFVPHHLAEKALTVLRELQRDGTTTYR